MLPKIFLFSLGKVEEPFSLPQAACNIYQEHFEAFAWISPRTFPMQRVVIRFALTFFIDYTRHKYTRWQNKVEVSCCFSSCQGWFAVSPYLSIFPCTFPSAMYHGLRRTIQTCVVSTIWISRQQRMMYLVGQNESPSIKKHSAAR